MSWYKSGTVDVTNGSATVIGTNTAWVANAKVGEEFRLPGAAGYEIAAVVSDNELTLARAYLAIDQTGLAYELVPVRGLLKGAADALYSAIATMQSHINGALSGKFADGTSATPGVSFIADPDTGMRRTGADTAALVAGGVDRLLFSSDGAEVPDGLNSSPIGQSDPAAGKFTALIADSLGGAAVQSSPGDTTAARALLVGAFGLGGYTVQAPAQDFDQIADRSGLFHVDSGGVNKPSFAANFSLLSLARSATLAAQMAFSLNSGTAARGRAAIRSKDSATTWTDWFEVFTQNSILGPVSETGGMPTGAVIESGANANGRYVRFADGTQICTKHFGTSASSHVWTYPAAFISSSGGALAISAVPFSSTAALATLDWTPTVTNATVKCWSHDGTAVSTQIHVTATGRWF